MSDTSDTIGRKDLDSMVLAKAVQDPAFAARLKADPKSALAELLGIALPHRLKVHVFQETPTELLIRLPMMDDGSMADGSMSDDELEDVAGGLHAVPGRGGPAAVALTVLNHGIPRRYFDRILPKRPRA